MLESESANIAGATPESTVSPRVVWRNRRRGSEFRRCSTATCTPPMTAPTSEIWAKATSGMPPRTASGGRWRWWQRGGGDSGHRLVSFRCSDALCTGSPCLRTTGSKSTPKLKKLRLPSRGKPEPAPYLPDVSHIWSCVSWSSHRYWFGAEGSIRPRMPGSMTHPLMMRDSARVARVSLGGRWTTSGQFPPLPAGHPSGVRLPK